MAFDQCATFVTETTTDELGLGRWASMKFTGLDQHSTWVVVSYMPCRTETADAKNIASVLAQHCRHLCYTLKDHCCPCQAAREDLISQLGLCMADGERIFLYSDVNESAH
eukprot:2584405-Ditylum_brightwellii.AAC.1